MQSHHSVPASPFERHFEPHYHCEIADSDEQRACAQELTDRIYHRNLGLPKADSAPLSPGCAILLVSQGSRPIATMTMQSAAFIRARDAAHPLPELELEQRYVLESLPIARAHVAEVRRMAAEPGHPGAASCLYAAGVELSRSAGISHWIGLVEGRGSRASDVPLLHRVLDAHGLVAHPLTLQPREAPAWFGEAHDCAPSAFSDEALKRLPVPPRLRSFARVFGARAVSVPCMHPRYPRVVVPMLAAVEPIGARFSP